MHCVLIIFLTQIYPLKKTIALTLIALTIGFTATAQQTINSIEQAVLLKAETVLRLNLNQKNYYDFPVQLQKFDSLKYLSLKKNRLGEIPEWFSELAALEEVHFEKNLIADIGILNLPKLTSLHLDKNQLDTVYLVRSRLPELEELFLNNNGLKYIDQGLCKITSLKNASVAFNELKLLPNCKAFENLEVFHAENNQLLQWPFKDARMSKLKELYLNNNQINRFPSNLQHLTSLEVLNLSNNDLRQIPSEISMLKNLKILTLSGNKLENLPESIKNCDKLKHLYLVNNPISEVELKKIKTHLPNCQVIM